jgi:hypothetical protein
LALPDLNIFRKKIYYYYLSVSTYSIDCFPARSTGCSHTKDSYATERLGYHGVSDADPSSSSSFGEEDIWSVGKDKSSSSVEEASTLSNRGVATSFVWHRGHTFRLCNHVLRHSAWKVWSQVNAPTRSPSSKGAKQIVQLSSSSTSFPPCSDWLKD